MKLILAEKRMYNSRKVFTWEQHGYISHNMVEQGLTLDCDAGCLLDCSFTTFEFVPGS